MKLGIRGRLFLLSAALIAATVLILDVYVSSALRSAVEERLTADLRVRAALIAHDVQAQTAQCDWQALAEELGRKALVRATLIAGDGTVLGDSEVKRDRLPALENHATRPEVREAMSSRFGSAHRESTTIHHGLLYLALRAEGSGPVAVVRLAHSLEPIEAAVGKARELLLGGSLIAALAATALLSAGAHLVSRSLRQLRRAASAMVDDLTVRTRLRGADEVGALGASLDRLADHLSHSLAQLASERDRLEAILETMAEGVLCTDADGRVVLANASLRTMLSASNPIVGRPPIEAIRNDELAEIIARVSRTGATANTEIDVAAMTARRVRVRVSPLAGGGSEGVVAVLADVTDLKRLESLRRDFVANVSHELRTPIAAIRAAVETLEQGAIRDPEAAGEFVSIVSRHGHRLQELVEDLLRLSQIEAQKLELVPTRIDVAELLGRLVELYRLPAERHSVGLSRGECAARLFVTADARALEQVLSNLIDNAIKYAPRASVTLSAAWTDGELHIAVEDTGPGIAKNHLPRLFERFYRVDRGRSRDVGGTGLGLSIVKHLTEAMGGRVTVESVVGRGSTFTLHMPATTEIPAPFTLSEARQKDG